MAFSGRKDGAKPTGMRYDDPTPEEIRIRCLEVQAEWSPEDEARRRGVREATTNCDMQVTKYWGDKRD